jgi:hypothetical protein
MNCQFCGKQLPQASTGKRERQYCNNAHKHLQQLQEARLRIRLLERLILRAGLALPTQIKRADQGLTPPSALAHLDVEYLNLAYEK